MDAQALARWQALDAERDRAWATGERYLAERASIEGAYQGDERRARVTALQDRLFGAEAGVVRATPPHSPAVSTTFPTLRRSCR